MIMIITVHMNETNKDNEYTDTKNSKADKQIS